MKEKIFINKTGGCICGNITFNVKLDEVPLVFNCHCIDCRKKIGGMMTIILLRDGAINIDKSKLKILSAFDLNDAAKKIVSAIK